MLKTTEVEQMPWSNNQLSMYYDYCHIGPYIQNRVTGNAAIDGMGERNRKRLRNTGLDNKNLWVLERSISLTYYR